MSTDRPLPTPCTPEEAGNRILALEDLDHCAYTENGRERDLVVCEERTDYVIESIHDNGPSFGVCRLHAAWARAIRPDLIGAMHSVEPEGTSGRGCLDMARKPTPETGSADTGSR